MHITLESDYAVRIVYCLAQNGGRLDAASIAEQTGVTLRFSLKILRKLVAGELVKSYKGAGGGYELARDPHEISLYEVIEQVEGPYAISRCLNEEGYDCNRNRQACMECKFVRIYADISEMVRKQLEGISFGDVEADLNYIESKDTVCLLYYPEINEFQGRRIVQAVIESWR